jgi:hypothetical protein
LPFDPWQHDLTFKSASCTGLQLTNLIVQPQFTDINDSKPSSVSVGDEWFRNRNISDLWTNNEIGLSEDYQIEKNDAEEIGERKEMRF